MTLVGRGRIDLRYLIGAALYGVDLAFPTPAKHLAKTDAAAWPGISRMIHHVLATAGLR
jgi:hypothetical protein